MIFDDFWSVFGLFGPLFNILASRERFFRRPRIRRQRLESADASAHTGDLKKIVSL